MPCCWRQQALHNMWTEPSLRLERFTVSAESRFYQT